MPSFNPNEYTTVAERLTRAKDDLQTIIAEPPAMLTDVMGYIRVTVALKDGRTSTGMASFRLDLTGGRAQATNPIEDCETSAIGRALGMLGYGSTKSVVSREEMHEAERRRETPAQNGATYAKPTNGSTPGKISDAQRKKLFVVWKEQGFEGELQAWVATNYNCKVEELSMKDASAAIEFLSKPAQPLGYVKPANE